MKNTKPMRKVLSLVLTLVMVFGSFGGTGIFAATEENKVYTNGAVSWEVVDGSIYPIAHSSEKLAPAVDEKPEYEDTDVVRVSIVLKENSTIKKFAAENIANNKQAMKYRADLESKQDKLSSKISKKVLNGEKLDVVWNLTLAANIISANVEYGKIEEIKALADVADVFVENCYEAQTAGASDAPNMGTSSGMIGSPVAWSAGYTGAGSKVAIVDTGVAFDHQSFAEDGYVYAMKQNAEAAGMSYDEYMTSVGVLTAADVAAVWDQLHASEFAAANAAGAYRTAKIPFAVNYVDKDLDVHHINDAQGEHGSHVTGIAAGNRFIANGDGSFSPALEKAGTQGVAPDAQIVTMKVFGKGGGAYDSDYMIAIEDAIVLGCDSVNLSLGSSNPGREYAGNYEQVMEDITKSGTVVVMSAGNSGSWFENTYYGYLYADDAAIDTVGSPGSFTNTLAVASIDNDGVTGSPLKFGDLTAYYTESSYSNAPMASIGRDEAYDYVYFDNAGVDGNNKSLFIGYEDVIAGKIVLVNRGTSSFYQKMDAAAAAGAIACVIVNNQAGTINMDLKDATSTIPCVSITLADGETVKATSTDAGDYYTGSVVVGKVVDIVPYGSEYYTMSDFSSWGVPGSLELKPEITAPGGNIYSVNGAHYDSNSGKIIGGTATYELMSGTSMAAPQTTGMVAVLAQYLRENGLTDQLGYSARQLANSLLMSTAKPVVEDFDVYTNSAEETSGYYSVLKQGAGLAQIDKAVNAKTFLMMADNATKSAADGKIKVELGDDPERKGVYTFGFSINNMESTSKVFNLYADMFTQDVFDGFGDGTMLLDTWTVSLDSTAEWKVNGTTVVPDPTVIQYDFDGDGDIDTDDGKAILDLSTGVITSISNADKADFDADGDVDTYDAYLFFKLLSEAAVIVPADGKIDVECTITLQNIDDFDYAGAFVEGYVYAEEVPTEEGVLGDLHSIPVIGYYGSWTDPGMFDKGTVAEYDSGEETRTPYLYSVNGTEYENALLVVYPDDPNTYIYGGNPISWDDEYMPERDAISSVNGMKIAGVQYTLIRNADAGVLQLTDEDGTTYFKKELGSVNSAYYYTNQSKWMGTISSVKADYVFTGGAEGKKASVDLTMVPEYYTIGGQTVDYDALGEGATKSFSFTIDNTAPEIVSFDVQKDDVSNERTLVLTVKDNQYVAGIVVLDNAGYMIDFFGSDPDAEAGAETVYEIPVGDYQKVNVQVYDYAYNVTSTRVKVDPDAPPVPVTGITVTPESASLLKGGTAVLSAEIAPLDADNIDVIWSSSDENVATVTQTGVVTGIAPGTATIKATSAENDTIFDTAEITVEILDITLHGVLQDEQGNPETMTWNLETDDNWKKGVNLPTSINAFTDDWVHAFGENAESGGFVHDTEGYLHVVSLDTGTEFARSEATCGFGIPMNDLAMANFTNFIDEAGNTYMMGVSEGYFLHSMNLDNSFNRGWNIGGSYFPLFGGSQYEAICWAGMDPDTGFDMFLAIDNANNIWGLSPDFSTGNANVYLYFTDLNLSWPGYDDDGINYSYSSLCMGDDGNLYLSYFTGTTNEIYQLILDEDTGDFTSRYICEVGDGVWPCSIYEVTLNGEESLSAPEFREAKLASVPAERQFTVQAEEVKAETNAKGSLNAVAAPSAAKKPVNKVMGGLNAVGDKYTVEVTAEEDSTNGKIEITWDPAAAELVSFDSDADYTSVLDDSANGKVVFAYADVDGITAGNALAEIEFTKLAAPAMAHVKFAEFNEDGEGDVDNEFDVCIPNHADTVTKDAKEATCTEDGYTGDIFCEDCGELIEKGSVVPATGHGEPEVKDAKEATCTEDGYTGDKICPTCGEVLEKGEVIPATGHDFDTEKPEYTWNEDKTECTVSFTCTKCGEKDEHECEVTEEVVTEATETEPGLKKVTATYTDKDGKVYTTTVEIVIPVKKSPVTGFVISGIGMVGALGAAAYVFGRKRKEDEE